MEGREGGGMEGREGRGREGGGGRPGTERGEGRQGGGSPWAGSEVVRDKADLHNLSQVGWAGVVSRWKRDGEGNY